MRLAWWALAVLLAAGTASGWMAWRGAGVFAACAAVDGDTLRCGRERVRLVGLDAPELQGRCARERRLAVAARDRLNGIVLRGGITLQRQRRPDRYGRTLAVVRDRQGRDVAAVLIAEGLARPYARGRRGSWC